MSKAYAIMLASLCVACGGTTGSRSTSSSCSYDGKTYEVGDTFPATDGCNSCQCTQKGTEAVATCSSKGCVPPALDEDTCVYDGKIYKTGDVFPATDGCNSCSCNPEGTKGVGCSMRLCDPCFACGADEACVQLFDGTCSTSGIQCVKVSAACLTGECTAECEVELCGEGPYQCRYQAPCGTELGAKVNCYGP